MKGKLTLITPPDIFENFNDSILFIHLNDADQDSVSKWLGATDFTQDINLYVYNGEPDVKWVLWALGQCRYKYIGLDDSNEITQALAGYILGKSNVFYKTTNENIAAVYRHINVNRISQIEHFLERALSDKTN